MDINALIRIVTGFTGALAFGILFNVRGKFLIFASIGGFLSTLGFELLIYLGIGETFTCFLVSLFIALYCEIFARLVKTPATTFLMTSLVPLIPGGALYYTMSYALERNWVLFYQSAYYALRIALALAVGIIVTTTMFQLFMLLHSFRMNKKLQKQ